MGSGYPSFEEMRQMRERRRALASGVLIGVFCSWIVLVFGALGFIFGALR